MHNLHRIGVYLTSFASLFLLDDDSQLGHY